MAPVEFILYVKDQQAATAFYTAVLGKQPVLNVPGMTEFELNDACKLGLMPEKGIASLLGNALPAPGAGNGIPRCELYLMVSDPDAEYNRAIQIGALKVNPPADRDWGHRVAYCADADGHILAFARAI